MKKLDKSLFYSFGPILSRNAVFNFCVGGRGIGKTYGAAKLGIKNYLKDGQQFIYLRRYREELAAARKTFFAAVAQEFPGVEFRENGNKGELCRTPDAEKKDKVWETVCYFVNLSTAQQFKSVNYSRVTLIIFDEFIIEKGNVQYLTNEARVMLDFYSTVDRWQDKTRVLFLANAVTIINPYFMEWNIQPNGQEFMTRGKGFVCVHFPQDGAFGDAVRKTRFGQFIEGTEYADYSIGNQFRDNGTSMLGNKTPDHKYCFTLETDGGTFSCWRAWDIVNSTTWHVQAKRPKEEATVTLVPARMTPDKVLVNFSDPVLSSLRTAFRQGVVTFDAAATRNAFIHIFNRKG